MLSWEILVRLLARNAAARALADKLSHLKRFNSLGAHSRCHSECDA